MNLFRKKNELKKLEQEYTKLLAERQKASSNIVNWRAKMDKAVKDDDHKRYQEASDKHTYYLARLEQIKQEKDVVEAKITEIKEQKIKDVEQEKDNEFKEEAIAILTSINQALQKGDYSNAVILIDDLDKFYKREAFKASEKVRKPFSYLGIQSMKIRLSHILEKYADQTRISATRGPSIAANVKGKVSLWSTTLQGQIDSAIEMFKDKA